MKKKLPLIVGFLILLLAFILVGTARFQAVLEDYFQQSQQAPIFENLQITRGFTSRWADNTITYDILVRDNVVPRVAYWSKAFIGNLRLSIIDMDGRLVYEKQGRNTNALEEIPLQSGRYTLQLVFQHYSGSARFGFANLTFITDFPSEQYRTVPADREAGFYWDYLLYVPVSVKSRYLLVIPNNTGYEENDIAFHRAAAQDLIREMSVLADELGCPLLVPVFPRPAGDLEAYYTHNLDRDVLLMDQEGYQRLDLQLLAMLDDARERLKAEQVDTDERFLMWGFSASGTFADRFSLLHPDRLKAVAGGGCTHSLPFAAYGGENLPYPIGTYDYETITGHPFDDQAFAALPRFLYKGDQDPGGTETVDGVTYPANEYFERFVREPLETGLDSLPVPIVQGFNMTEDEEQSIKYRIYDGAVLVDEFRAVREIYAEAGLTNTHFKLYPGVGHDITDEMMGDVIVFFRKVME